MLKKIFLCLLMAFSLNSVCFAAENLIGNPSFEEDLSGWVTSGGGELSQSTERAVAGNASLKAKVPWAYAPVARYNTADVIAQKGAGDYKMSVWVYIDANGKSLTSENTKFRMFCQDATLSFHNVNSTFYRPKREGIPNKFADTPVQCGEWTNILGYFTVTDDDYAKITQNTSKYIYFDIQANTANLDGYYIYVDEAYLVKSVDPEVVSYSPAGAGNNIQSSVVTVTFNKEMDVNTISNISVFENGIEMECTRELSDNGTVCTITLTRGNLLEESDYIIKVSDGVHDTEGKAVKAAEYKFSTRKLVISDVEVEAEEDGENIIYTATAFVSNAGTSEKDVTVIVYAEYNGRFIALGSKSLTAEAGADNVKISAELSLAPEYVDCTVKTIVIDNFTDMNILKK